jgi:hypothetical protein
MQDEMQGSCRRRSPAALPCQPRSHSRQLLGRTDTVQRYPIPDCTATYSSRPRQLAPGGPRSARQQSAPLRHRCGGCEGAPPLGFGPGLCAPEFSTILTWHAKAHMQGSSCPLLLAQCAGQGLPAPLPCPALPWTNTASASGGPAVGTWWQAGPGREPALARALRPRASHGQSVALAPGARQPR